MMKKPFLKKLVLKKEIIETLRDDELSKIFGGEDTYDDYSRTVTVACPSVPPACPVPSVGCTKRISIDLACNPTGPYCV